MSTSALIDRLAATPRTLALLVVEETEEGLDAAPPGEWSARTLLAHLRDDEYLCMRVALERMLAQDDPEVLFIEGEDWEPGRNRGRDRRDQLLADFALQHALGPAAQVQLPVEVEQDREVARAAGHAVGVPELHGGPAGARGRGAPEGAHRRGRGDRDPGLQDRERDVVEQVLVALEVAHVLDRLAQCDLGDRVRRRGERRARRAPDAAQELLARRLVAVHLRAADDELHEPRRPSRAHTRARHHADALRRARLMVSGSAPLPVPVFEHLQALTGHAPVERYGMTETLITLSTRAEGERRPGWVGTPIDGVVTRLVADDGMPAPHDGEHIGELWVRGDTLFDGYLGKPDATRDSYVDGWLRTGDAAVIDAGGFHRIVGRSSIDIIKTGGYKVGAGEVETWLLSHPAVSEVAVVGVTDDDLGQRVVAYVVASSAVEESVLIVHVADSLSAHKRPREIRFVEALPRNAMGKVQKSLLID